MELNQIANLLTYNVEVYLVESKFIRGLLTIVGSSNVADFLTKPALSQIIPTNVEWCAA